jgi:serine/threonine-protein kinase HipA
MPLPEIHVCPSTLRPGFTTYSPAAQASLFGARSRKVPHVLPFGPPGKNPELTREYNEKRKRISISGVQEKYSLKQERNTLRLTDTDGTHILKPIPTERLNFLSDLPANEHLTMQIAAQVFGIRTAACGMIFFDDSSPAYLTRRFDRKPDGSGKFQIEDFATLLNRTPEREGDQFKYNASYQDITNTIYQYVAAAPVVMLEFFRQLLFSYLIANGDAHLKNFSLLETTQGDFILSPAYDLLCTALHLDDSLLALNEGLYPEDYNEKTFYDLGMYTGASFLAFANQVGIAPTLARQVLAGFLARIPAAIPLIHRSFLTEPAKTRYLEVFTNRQNLLNRQ